MYRLLVAVITRLKPRLVYWLARRLGDVVWFCDAYHRNVAIRNLEIAFRDHYSPEERRRIAKESLYHFLMTMMDVFLVPPYFLSGRWEEILEFSEEQRAYMDRMAAHDGPVILLTGHMGSWETTVGIPYVWHMKTSTIYRNLPHPKIDQHLRCNFREAYQSELISRDGALRGFVRVLRQKGCFTLLLDLNMGRNAAFTNFMEVAASTDLQLFFLCRKYKPKIAAAFFLRDGHRFRFKAKGFFDVPVDQGADEHEEAMRLVQWYTDCVVKMVKQYPEQYLWLHRRYASRPPSVPEPFRNLYQNLEKPLDPELLEKQPTGPILPERWLRKGTTD